MAFLGRQPLPPGHYLNKGPSLFLQSQPETLPASPRPPNPVTQETEEDGIHGETLRRLKIHHDARVSIARAQAASKAQAPSPGGPGTPTDDPTKG